MTYKTYTVYFALIGLIMLGSLQLAPAQHHEGDSPEIYHSTKLAFGNQREARQSLEWIKERGGTDMVAHLITASRFSSLSREEIGEAIQDITGETSINTWFDWMIWLELRPEIEPHNSYLNFKSAVFYSIDPNFRRLFRPGMQFDIRPEEIVWGGVRLDGIPALDNPKHISIEEATYLKDDDEVFGVNINGDARAYPLRIMGWHEMFNDVVGGVPVSLAYCTLCNAGILFEGDYQGREKLNVKEPFTFGSSGFLYRSNKLMYDRQTDSLWNQFTGEPVAGPLLGTGVRLNIRPVVITSWKEWKATNPNTKVLSLKTGYRRNYGSGVVYKQYFESSTLMFPALGDKKKRLRKKEEVFGMRLESGVKAWPLNSFKYKKVLNDKVGQVNVVLIGNQKTRTVRAYERQNLEFTLNDAGALVDQSGVSWEIKESGLKDSKGESLKRLPGHIAYWFAWAGYLGEESALFTE